MGPGLLDPEVLDPELLGHILVTASSSHILVPELLGHILDPKALDPGAFC